jgi:hypothetical protein
MKTKSLALFAAIATAACPLMAQSNDGIQARVINALPQSQGISVKIGATQLFDGIKPHEISPFKAIPQQDDQKVTIQNGTQQLQTKDELSFDDNNEDYTVLVTPDKDAANPKVIVLKDDRDTVDQDEVELTVINAAPEHKSVKVRLNDDTEDRGINYGESSDNDVKPGVYNLAIIDASGNDTVIANKSVTLTGGTAVTVLLTSPNNVKIVNDNSPQADMAAGGNAQVRDRATSGAATQAPATMTTPAMSM